MRSHRVHTEVMSDRLHDHLSLGFHPGCPACEQTAEIVAADPNTNDRDLLLVVAA